MGEDDIFDAVVNLEEAQLQEGFEDGFARGVEEGEAEGRQVGLKTGFEAGEELGFYSGCASVWLAALQQQQQEHLQRSPNRAQRVIRQLQELLREYPYLEPEDESVQERLGAIRSKFKVAASLLRVNLSYPGLQLEQEKHTF